MLQLIHLTASAHPWRKFRFQRILHESCDRFQLLHELILSLGDSHELTQCDTILLFFSQEIAQFFHTCHVKLNCVEEGLVLGGRRLDLGGGRISLFLFNHVL